MQWHPVRLEFFIKRSSINPCAVQCRYSIELFWLLNSNFNRAFTYIQPCSEAVAQRCSIKKVFLEISQNPQKNTCTRASFLIKLQALAYHFIKKRLWHRCFSVTFAKFQRTPSPIEHLDWLLLHVTW